MLKVTSLLIYKKFEFEYFLNEQNGLMKYRNFKKKFEKKIFQTGCAT